MKKIIINVMLITCLGAITASAQMTFKHPGANNSKEELDFVKGKIKEGAEPWTSAFNQMLLLAKSDTITVAPLEGVNTENAQKNNGLKAYANALAWYFTDNVTYAENAIKILNVWGKTFKGYSVPTVGQGSQSQLDAGWIGCLLSSAAEIVRGYSGWNQTDIAAVQTMFKTKFYPALNQVSGWNGNVDLTQIDAMMRISVFCEDVKEFNDGLTRLKLRNPAYFYLSDDIITSRNYGGSNYPGSWFTPSSIVDGVNAETCRDNDFHNQFAIASAMSAAEVAWHQGVDVYTENEKRYVATLELTAKQLFTGNMQGVCPNNVTTSSQFDTWEIAYNHYHNRKGIDLPFTKQLIDSKIRTTPLAQSEWNIFFETLTHAEANTNTNTNTTTIAATGLTISQDSVTFNVGKTLQLSALFTPSNASNQSVTWTSTNESVATISANGLVTAIASGIVTITALSVDGSFSASSTLIIKDPTVAVIPPSTWVHPGAYNTKEELEFIKAQIKAGAEPWASSFKQMLTLATSYNKTVSPQDNFTEENAQKIDAQQAYANALAWYFTDNVTYADNAIAILNVWGKTFKGYTVPLVGQGNQSQLDAGWIGSLMGSAAEIMRAYTSWTSSDMAMVQTMFKTQFYPALNQMSTWNGSVDLTQIDAIMNLAVFCEDKTEFDLGLSRLRARNSYFYLTSDAKPTENWFNPTSFVDGLTQESCRDNDHHSQFGLASAIHAAEIAWHQGVDIYKENATRYIAAMELMAKQMLSGSMQGVCTNNVTSTDKYDTWEMAYNHYHNVSGIELPNTQRLILNKVRTSPLATSDWNIFFETLTHAGVEPIGMCSPSFKTLTISSCGSYTLNGTVYTETGFYTQTIPNVGGCDSTITVQLTINNTPTIIASPSIIKAGESSVLTVTGGTAYIWNNNITTASQVVSPAVTTTYTVTATNGIGCSGMANVVVTVLPSVTDPIIIEDTLSIQIGDQIDLLNQFPNIIKDGLTWLNNPDQVLSSKDNFVWGISPGTSKLTAYSADKMTIYWFYISVKKPITPIVSVKPIIETVTMIDKNTIQIQFNQDLTAENIKILLDILYNSATLKADGIVKATVLSVDIDKNNPKIVTVKVKETLPTTFTIEYTGTSLETKNGNKIEAFTYQVKAGSTSAEEVQIEARLFPNPVVDNVTINSLDGNISTITISDVKGSIVTMVQNVKAPKVELNVSSLSKGIYIVTITTENNNISTMQFIK